ncbi:helix-turn-helix transcriptional regulator [Acidaminobacter sp.]|uniref:helix-turn-helix transcriptional regulator n=1 Tax=Acidaminobacter sp. TaxID=1872102 RepID=UPI002567B333|nr:WYL domain-containing protein [Acidaminobacter sp.]MDK9711207.1 WYL domain-containing protein [Acidaminobacter sp.]
MIAFGYDIVCNKGRRFEYFMGDRHFEIPELKLLIDAVQAAHFISTQKSQALIGKFTTFTSLHQQDELVRHLYVDKQIKTSNEQLYITADLLHTAINAGKKVQFKYFEYDRDKKKVFKHSGKVYSFSPYGLVWNHENYYVAGFSDSHDKIITFRVDRITAPKMTASQAVPRPDDFDMSIYGKRVFKMYDGQLREVILKCENSMMKYIIDQFGEDVETVAFSDTHFTAKVEASASQTFYGWIFSFGGKIKVHKPDDVLAEFDAMLASFQKTSE